MYLIIAEWPSDGRPAPVSLDQAADIDGALMFARQLFTACAANVTIRDEKENNISGPDIIACCNRQKMLTPDLRVRPGSFIAASLHHSSTRNGTIV